MFPDIEGIKVQSQWLDAARAARESSASKPAKKTGQEKPFRIFQAFASLASFLKQGISAFKSLFSGKSFQTCFNNATTAQVHDLAYPYLR